MTHEPLVQPRPAQHPEVELQLRKAGLQTGEMQVPLLPSQVLPVQHAPPPLQRWPKVKHELPPPASAPQSDCSQSQVAFEQTPSDEPVPVPARQLPLHQPQESCAVQVVQFEPGHTSDPASGLMPASVPTTAQRPAMHESPAQQSEVALQPAPTTPHEARQ